MNKINTSVNFQSLMSTIIDSAKELLQSEGASLLLMDRETDELIFDIVISNKGEIIQGKRIKPGVGIAGQVALTGQPLIVNDVASDSRFFSDIDKASGFYTKSIIAVPVIMKDRLVGVLEAVNSLRPECFTDDDLTMIGYLADAAAVSINNQELVKSLSNRVDELTCIYEISQSIYFSMDIESFLRRVIDAINKVIRAERCSFVILNEDGSGAKYFVSNEGFSDPSAVDVTTSLMSHVIRTGDPLLVYNLDEYKHSADSVSGRYKSKSFMCLPMKLRDKVIGVLNVTDKPHSEIFDSFDLRVLSTISQQVSEMYENVQLQSAEIERKRIEHDLLIAADIQKRAMPELPEHAVGLSAGAFMHPARYVGGDFYEFSELDGRYVLAGVGDISGKGIPAAMFMSTVRHELKIAALKIQSPDALFEIANKEIYKNSFSGMFCTGFYCLIDRKKKNMKYASAGHNAQLYYSVATESFFELPKTGRALGISHDSVYRTLTRGYFPGDILVLFTDGLFEQNAESELTMEELQAIVRKHKNDSVGCIADFIHRRVKEKSRLREPKDDSTLMVIKFE